jgi:hypothetical protein
LHAEIANLTDAIASGALRTSKAVAERLAVAESELERLERQRPIQSAKALKLPGQIEAIYGCLVESLETELRRDVHKARTVLRRIVGGRDPM